MQTRRGRAWWVAACLGLTAAAALPGCASPSPADDAAPAIDAVETRLYLIGDAGEPSPGDPVLAALKAQVAADPVRSYVVFLGDNIYPSGLPAEGVPGRREAERHLDAQIDVMAAAGARGLFVPGNHDWAAWGPDGWNAVRRQGERVARRGAPGITLLPPGGCPGPSVQDVDTRLRVIALDTQWWLHAYEKPRHPDSTCAHDSEEEVVSGLRTAVESAGDRRVVVVGHHPLASAGIHGGYFGWRDHIFPLREKYKWLWLPLPGVGSAYPLARQRGITNQDLSGRLNVQMREAIASAFDKVRPLVYAAGHEHNLQVLRGKSAEYLVVSGAGFFGHTTRTSRTEGMLFGREASGFVRLDIGRDGRVRLAVVSVDARGRTDEVFSKML
jgi:calcineurin-like phosphoesterase family protein